MKMKDQPVMSPLLRFTDNQNLFFKIPRSSRKNNLFHFMVQIEDYSCRKVHYQTRFSIHRFIYIYFRSSQNLNKNNQKQSPGGVLRNFAKFTEKHLCHSLFFNKVAGLRPETLAQVFSCEFCKTSKNTFSYRTPPVAASE